MQPRASLITVVMLFIALVLPANIYAQPNTAVLTLEESTNGLSGWKSVQIIQVAPASSSAFYRMRIAMPSPSPTPTPSPTMITVQAGVLPPSSSFSGKSVAAFRIGRYEVTWKEWLEVRTWAASNGYGDIASIGQGSADDHPVRNVSFYDVVKWCNARSERDGFVPAYEANGSVYRTGQATPTVNSNANGYRLPTDIEWEWAARGGVSSLFFLYSGSDDPNAVAWYSSNSSNGTRPIGTKIANEIGVHDMSGNVGEWSLVTQTSVFFNSPVRGGGWASSSLEIEVGDSTNPGLSWRGSTIGFRVARNAQ